MPVAGILKLLEQLVGGRASHGHDIPATAYMQGQGGVLSRSAIGHLMTLQALSAAQAVPCCAPQVTLSSDAVRPAQAPPAD